jgi:hypothetical protein
MSFLSFEIKRVEKAFLLIIDDLDEIFLFGIENAIN